MTIKELRLLPPLAFARFGAATDPQANYTLSENPDDPLGFRRITPAATLRVANDGKVKNLPAAGTDPTPAELQNEIFRNDDQIRPVAPFFEVFVVTDKKKNSLVPLTFKMLAKHRIDVNKIAWKVRVENRKVYRRTGEKRDIVKVETKWFTGHRRKRLKGRCDNFIKGETIDFGFVQFIKPSQGNDAVTSRIRLRFTPGPGKIYGPLDEPKRNGARLIENPVTPIYKGSWTSFDEKMPPKGGPRETLPPSLYAIRPPAPPWLNGDHAVSRGYFDDACDGFIEVKIGAKLKAKARICVGPPSFVPDCQFIRTLDDDLDQVVNGPHAADIDAAEARERALDIVRRAYEAVRFMNVGVMNGNPIKGRPAAEFDSMPAEESFGTDRLVRPVMSPASVDTAAILGLHQQVYAALSSGAAPWFLGLLRRPNEVGDLTDRGRRKMPALMSGADSLYLALTYRQIATIEMAATLGTRDPQTDTKGTPDSMPALSPRNLTAQLRYPAVGKASLTAQMRHPAAGNPVNSRPEMAIANCCPGLEVDFRAVWRRLFEGIELSEHDNYVVNDTRVDADGEQVEPSLKGHRLLSIGRGKDDKITSTAPGEPVIVKLKGPSPSNPYGNVPVLSQRNPHGVWTMEWSNCLAHVVDALRTHRAEENLASTSAANFEIDCEFTADATETPQPQGTKCIVTRLRVMDFFEGQTAVISEKLAEPGELTQGLCSPWQNDLRECSCYYWASSRPDFVNTSIGNDGLSHGDNWFARQRTGEYVPDDYADTRLIDYDELFRNWQQLQFQIGGKDSAPHLPSHRAARSPGKS
jgi:hypothetical protein